MLRPVPVPLYLQQIGAADIMVVDIGAAAIPAANRGHQVI